MQRWPIHKPELIKSTVTNLHIARRLSSPRTRNRLYSEEHWWAASDVSKHAILFSIKSPRTPRVFEHFAIAVKTFPVGKAFILKSALHVYRASSCFLFSDFPTSVFFQFFETGVVFPAKVISIISFKIRFSAFKVGAMQLLERTNTGITLAQML